MSEEAASNPLGLQRTRLGFERTRVKICGITREVDAAHALRCGADSLGFNAWPGSKRFLDVAVAAEWIGRLARWGSRVCVLVNPTDAELERVLACGCFDLLQLHGDESPKRCEQVLRLGLPVIKAVRVGAGFSAASLSDWPVSDMLLDAAVPGQYGGSGKTFDWAIARAAVEHASDKRILLSGGLMPDNVEEAIRAVRPFAVDVASGVELEPGVKNAALVHAFCQRAAAADRGRDTSADPADLLNR